MENKMEIDYHDIEYKIKNAIFEDGDYIFYPLPHDEEFIRLEGVNMNHCLAYAQKDYCNRMKAGEIIVYSMTDKILNLPVVDIELAITRSSYGGPVVEPTVSQIRGEANELPPNDVFMPSLMKFLQNYGKTWNIESHGVKNFDYQCDGDVVLARWKEMNKTQSSS